MLADIHQHQALGSAAVRGSMGLSGSNRDGALPSGVVDRWDTGKRFSPVLRWSGATEKATNLRCESKRRMSASISKLVTTPNGEMTSAVPLDFLIVKVLALKKTKVDGKGSSSYEVMTKEKLVGICLMCTHEVASPDTQKYSTTLQYDPEAGATKNIKTVSESHTTAKWGSPKIAFESRALKGGICGSRSNCKLRDPPSPLVPGQSRTHPPDKEKARAMIYEAEPQGIPAIP